MSTGFRGVTRCGTRYLVTNHQLMVLHGVSSYTLLNFNSQADREAVCGALNDGVEPGDWLEEYGEIHHYG